MASPIVLAFSGGLDTSYLVPWLRERYGRPVLAVTVNTGGWSEADARSLADRASALGAAGHRLVDARETFFHEVLRFLIFGNVQRGQVYPLCVGAERVVQARALVEVAREEGAGAIAHGSTAAGNDQVRFEVFLRTLAPDLEILAPLRDHPVQREEAASYLRQRGLPLPPRGGAYSINRGLWGVTIGGRETLGSAAAPPEEAWVLTAGAFTNPRPPSRHRLAFTCGVPTALDGEALAPVALIERLEALAAPYGIGRGIHLGETVLGIKGRVAFEAPAAEVLLTAHRELEKLVLTHRQLRLKEELALRYGDLLHEGQFLDPVCRNLEALFASTQERVTGEVSLLFRPGSVFVAGVRSPYSLMAASRAAYGEAAGEWEGRDAAGFARLLALPGLLYRRAGEREQP